MDTFDSKCSFSDVDHSVVRKRVHTLDYTLNTTEHSAHDKTYVSTKVSSLLLEGIENDEVSACTDEPLVSSTCTSKEVCEENEEVTEQQNEHRRSRRLSERFRRDSEHICSTLSHAPQILCQKFVDEVRDLKLFAHAHLPDWLKDNDFLHQGHRGHTPCMITCFKSVFAIHSETVNIWTHLIGSLIILAFTLWFFIKPNTVPHTWQKALVFLVFSTSAVACMTFSWLYHTLYCHSVEMNKLFSKLDYSGIAFLTLGSFIPYLYYVFYCHENYMLFYIVAMVVLSSLCIMLCLWEKFAHPCYRPIRTVTFVGLGLSGVVPFVHTALDQGVDHSKLFYILTVAFLYISGALIYAFRVPERFVPGKLDIVGHSHQIFHVLVVLAAVVHYFGIVTMAEQRVELGECPAPHIS